MNDPIPWQSPPDRVPHEQKSMLLPQEMYDHLISLPPGTDITHYFEFEPGWDLTATTMERPTWDTMSSPLDSSGKDAAS